MSSIDRAFAALSDPTRRMILARLAEGEAQVGALADLAGISQPAVSRHLKVLEQAGLIETRVAAQSRPRRLRAEGLAPVRGWLAETQARFERNYQALDALLAELPPGDGAPPNDPTPDPGKD
ncbi:metalloregulator ArsR/SmtB family transcription factor [Rhodobacterales bacterium HKCCE2091]|nr:metalloregulator ArsR/SmtB family transcription factor [Rhodobacterales bacterium HKCCE2091]